MDGTFLIPDAMTVEEMLYKWIPIPSSKHKWAPKTYTHTVAMVQNLVVPYLGKKQIQKVQRYDLLIEDKDFAVVYNGSVGGTYDGSPRNG